MSPVQQKPILHGRDHACGGADAIPGICDISPASGSGTYQQQVLAEPSLVGYWPLDDADGPATDYSSSHRDLIEEVIPPTWRQPGPFPDDPDATSAAVDAPSGTTLSRSGLRDGNGGPSYQFAGVQPYTFEIFAYPTTWVLSGLMTVWSSPGGSPKGLRLMLNGDGTVSAWRAGVQFKSLQTLNLNSWTHVAMVYDGAQIRLYFNGQQMVATNTTASHSPSGVLQVGEDSDDFYQGNFVGRLAQAAIYSAALSGSTVASHANATTTSHNPGDVITTDPNGNPVWAPPTVGVTTNGDPATTPELTPNPPGSLSDPPTYWGATTDWINDQPFTYGGTTFTAQPNTWTTIPFTTPSMQRQSNVHSIGTLFQEIAWNSPDAAGWINPSDPHAIVVPHDMPINEGAGSPHGVWFQICLRLEVPAVELATSRRALRVFETTHQKPVVQINTWRNTIDLGGGSFDVVHGVTSTTDAIFANGNPGGTAVDIHQGTAFAPNDMAATSIFDWLPVDSVGNKTLKKGMRLVAQVWHNTASPLTFNAGGTYSGTLDGNYKPHLLVFASMDRAWGPPWSTWPPP